MLIAIFTLSLIGFCISLYTYFVEQKIKSDATYKAVCDINDRISCSKPIKSEYSNIFYFSNAVIGMGFYTFVAVLAYLNNLSLIAIAAAGSCIVSVFLAYILYFKIKALCILCTSLYLVNLGILVLALRALYF